jgi:hypothetical protein
MVARKFLIRPRIDPDCVVAPGARLIDRDQFGRGDRGLPRDTIAKIKSFAERWDKRECDKEQRLSNRARLHWLSRTGHQEQVPTGLARLHFNSERAAAQSKFSNARAESGRFHFARRNS